MDLVTSGGSLSITVSVVAPDTLTGAALAALLQRYPGIRVVAPEANPPPRVLVWDAGRGEPAQPPAHASATAILLLVDADTCPDPPPLVEGLFSREEGPEALAVAVRQVARGQGYVSPGLALALLRSHGARRAQGSINLSDLTARERVVLGLLGQGLSNKAIAARLYLSVRTVEGHLANLYPKLGVHSRLEAVLLAARLHPPIR